METVATAGGRIAYAGSNRLDAGVRVTILDGASGRMLFRGPVTETAERLSFDGTHLAWASGGCTLLATVGPVAASADVLPPGPCVRSEVWVGRLEDSRVEVRCLSTPGPTCRVEARWRGGSRVARVARGRARVVSLPRGTGRLTVRVTDPDGRTRTVYAD